MFFWTLLASLMGVVMFGNWHDNAKEQSVFVEPVYQALALQTYQQHITAENAFRRNIAEFVNYLGYQEQEGLTIPQKLEMTVRNNPDNPMGIELDGADAEIVGSNVTYRNPQKSFERFRYGYKPNAAVKTYLFCVSRDNQMLSDCQLNETEDNPTVQYIVTVREVPPKYRTSAKMSILKAIAEATSGSRNVGLLARHKNSNGMQSGEGIYQPLGACYYILSGGTSEAGRTFIPNGIVNALMSSPISLIQKSGAKADLTNHSYIISLSMMGGFGNMENMPKGSWSCNSL